MEGPEGQGNDFCLCKKKKKKKKGSSSTECSAQAGKDPSSAVPPSRAGSQEKLYINARPSVNPPLKRVRGFDSFRKKIAPLRKKLEKRKFSFNSFRLRRDTRFRTSQLPLIRRACFKKNVLEFSPPRVI